MKKTRGIKVGYSIYDADFEVFKGGMIEYYSISALFDKFESHMDLLKSKVEIHVRSVFTRVVFQKINKFQKLRPLKKH